MKIRINELARELEVKPNRILELLPELGITEKKTHSSSIDEELAQRIRARIRGEEESYPGIESATEERGLFDPVPAPAQVQPLPPPPPPLTEQQPAAAEPAPGVPSALPEPETPVKPLRPPLATGGPIHPPIQTAGAVRPPAPPAEPAPPPPPKPAVVPPAAVVAPGPKTAPAAAKPGPPAPRPGQILTGPRQPLLGTDRAEMPARAPGIPRPAPAPKAPAAPPSAPPQPALAKAATPGAPPARPLAAQPAARPVVPPRPELVARLQQTQKAAVPGQPVARGPMPGRPQTPTPRPGQPIYTGPLRPGQPPAARTAAGGAVARAGRARGMHPTSAPAIPPEPALTEAQRREAAKRGRAARPVLVEEEEGRLRETRKRQQQEALLAVNREITISEGITVKELSEKLGLKANLVIKKLVEKKIFATINQTLDVKMAEEIAREFGATTNQVSYEEESAQEIELHEDSKDLVKRPPVVTIMGHVDHGKTSLLDAIRSSNIADREAGGITQHIGAYYVEHNNQKIVFIDTPGHEAFTRMRARGAKVTDIVVLVVAADDGVMPQTLEAIDHAKAAGAPIIVAINKIDKPEAQPERIKQQLADRGLLAEDWGGDVVMVPVSAKARTNIDLLLEMILLVADMEDLKANPSRPAVGTVLEQKLDRGRGPVATVLVQNGTLRVGDYFICGAVFGKVRAMFDDRGNSIREAGPSMPVEVLGLESLPEVGDVFQVVTDTAKAKQIVMYRETKARDQAMARGAKLSLEQLHEQLREGETKELPIILKADVGGTAEVLTDTLHKLSTDKVKVRVLHAGVGAITETDVLLASASNAIIIGFNVRPDRNAAALAEQEKVDIRLHTIIYELTDEIKRAQTGMLEPVYKEVYKGRAEVRETFNISKVGTVAGCMVVDGVIPRDSQVRLLRDNVVIYTGRLGSLKRFKNDASEVKAGFECGASIAGFNDIKPNDIIEAFTLERVVPELTSA
jgi:translation initiation factor IF-2